MFGKRGRKDPGCHQTEDPSPLLVQPKYIRCDKSWDRTARLDFGGVLYSFFLRGDPLSPQLSASVEKDDRVPYP